MTIFDEMRALTAQLDTLIGRAEAGTTPATTTTTLAPITTTPAPVQLVTRTTPFRQTPVISVDRLCQILMGYPLAAECRAIHDVLGGRALAVAQSWMESSYGQSDNARLSFNALGLMDYTGRFPVVMIGDLPLRKFNSWAEGFAAWAQRMDDPAYGGGVYQPQDMSLAQYVYTYVGGPGCWSSGGATCANGETKASVERYLTETVDRINRYSGITSTTAPPANITTTTATPSSSIVFGRVPKPAGMQVRPIANNTAWDDLGSRQPRGIVLHRMLGTLNGTDNYFRTDARGSALTDFGVGAGSLGPVYQWNALDGRRAPWASGPADGVKEDGVPFVNRYGVNAINRDCASIEIEGVQYTDPVPAATWTALVELVAWLADSWLRVDYQTWPRNRDGLHCLLGHYEFTSQKPCPGSYVLGRVPELIESVRARLRQYQTGG